MFLSETKHCRWCRKAYTTKYSSIGDGFCSNAHKQALYRARKKYVTRINQVAARARKTDHKKR